MRAFYTFLCCVFIVGSTMAQSNDTSTSVKNVIEEKSFEINSNWASPLSNNVIVSLLPTGSDANNVSLIGNANHLIMNGENVEIYLPYFGDMRYVSGRNFERGTIEYKGAMEDYQVKYNEKKKHYTLKFKVRQNNELFKFSVTLHQNGKTSISINSARRTSIRYRGQLKEVTG